MDIRYYYDAAGHPVAIRLFDENHPDGIVYYLQTNLQGDVVAIYNKDGTKIYEYAYDAWGNIIKSAQVATGGSDAHAVNPFRYRGYYFDTETGFYYLQSRYYNPEWGRFLNADVYVNANGDLMGYNMYTYCSNNPVKHTDPSGEAIITIGLILAVTTVMGGIAGVAHTMKEAEEKDEEVKAFDMIKNVTFGMGAGLAVGGAIVSLGAVGAGLSAAATAGQMTAATAVMKATFLGTNVVKAFGIGGLSIHAFASFLLPLYGGSMDAPEYEPITQPRQPAQNSHSLHPAYK